MPNWDPDIGDKVENLVKMLVLEANTLQETINNKVTSMENIKNELERLRESEKSLRIKEEEENQHVRRENEELRKTLTTLGEETLLLCEENRKVASLSEKLRVKDTEVFMLKLNLKKKESSEKCKESQQIFDDTELGQKDSCSATGTSLKNILRSSKGLFDNLKSLHQKLEGTQKVNVTKTVSKDINDLNKTHDLEVECFTTQINAQAADLEKLRLSLKTVEKQLKANLEQEKRSSEVSNHRISCLQSDIIRRESEIDDLKRKNQSLRRRNNKLRIIAKMSAKFKPRRLTDVRVSAKKIVNKKNLQLNCPMSAISPKKRKFSD